MKLSDHIKKLIKDYFIIFAIIVISIAVLRQIFAPDLKFELKDIYLYMISALVGDLPSLILYSPKALSEKEMRVRTIIHFVVLEAILIIFAKIVVDLTGILSTIVFAFQIAIIYMLVRFLSWRGDRKEAGMINERLKAMKAGSGEESEE